MANSVNGQAAETTSAPRPARAVNIFVVRRWQPAGAETRYAIAHVRSGRRTVASGDAGAAAWIGGFGQGEGCPPERACTGQDEVA